MIGFGLILPGGVSGAVLAMGLGLYQPLIEAVARPFSDWRNKFRLLFPLALGVGICLLLFSRLLELLFVYYPLPTLYLFLGLVAGGLPSVVGWANRAGFRLSFLISFCLGGFCLLLFFDRSSPPIGSRVISWSGPPPPGFYAAGDAGGRRIGCSRAECFFFLLMAFGAYQGGLLNAVVRLNFAVLLPVFVGLLPAVVLMSRLINRALKNWGLCALWHIRPNYGGVFV